MKDTNNFFHKLSASNVTDNTYLVSLDVKFLYGSIPNAEGTKTIKELFEKLTSKNVATKVVTTFLALLLTLKTTFLLNCKLYLPINVCAIGTICAPLYINIFKNHFEKK